MKNLKRLFLFVLTAILPAQVLSQNFTLPSALVDSMVFEIRKGRECSATLTASLERITALENLTHSQSGLIELRGKEVATLKELDANWELRLDNTNKSFLIEKSELRQKVKKRNRIILAECGLIGLLVLILLL